MNFQRQKPSPHLTLIVCSPGGNITGIIQGDIKKQHKVQIASIVMKKNKNIEQVGFIFPSQKRGIQAHLSMMGNEFCGNAARSLAYIITQSYIPFAHPKPKNKFLITVSGISDPIQCSVKNDNVQINFGLPQHTPLYQKCGSEHIVHLEGISFIITEGKSGNKKHAWDTIQKRGFKPAKSIGVIYAKTIGNKIYIDPYVFVKKTKSFVHETSSASGAVASAIRQLYKTKKSSNNLYTVIPPSGIPLFVKIFKDKNKKDNIKSVSVEGKVHILYTKTIVYPLN